MSTHLEDLSKDFRNFLFVVWKFLALPPPTEKQYEIAHYLQHGPKRKCIEGFRGVGKSWITSAYVLWVLRFVNPDAKFLVVSASKSRADDFSAFTKRLIHEMPLLQVLKATDKQRDSMIAFDVGPARPAHAPSVKSVGIFGQLTGSRADVIIGDDVEVANNSATQDMREKLEKATKEFEAILVPGGRVTFLGTPQTEESIYNKLPERGYGMCIWPSEYPSEAEHFLYRGFLAESIVKAVLVDPGLAGHSTDPLRFSDEDLLERRASYGRSGYALQFMLNTTLSDAEKYPLKLADLILTNLNTEQAPVALQYASSPELQVKDIPNIGFTGDRYFRPLYMSKDWTKYEGKVMAIDPSGRGKDETSFAVVNQLHGHLYVPAWGGFAGGYDDATLEALAKVAKEFKPNTIVIEDNFGDGMFTKIFSPILRKHHTCSIEEVKQFQQKEARIIDTLEPVMNRHRLIFDIDMVKKDIKETSESPMYSLLYQLTRITRDRGALRHDDRLDALSVAVKYFTESMAKNENDAEEAWKEQQLEEELRVFMEEALMDDTMTVDTWKQERESWIHTLHG